ncbi:MAG: glycine cleavage system aminomethyltransferase GcvT [Deltaproteobacteria bacterium]|nr:glycine cleavage system aminomethyltransferase GcvT [Deltaproteobacteria bacterium]
MSETLQRTPLYDAHVKLGGKLVPFAGWEMPVNYPAGLLAEHEAVRTRVGLFDVSHMGQFEFQGPEAVAAVDKLVTNDIRKLEVGRAAYAGLLNERGTFIDDVFVYKLAPEHLLMVVNASNVAKDFDWVASHCPKGLPQNRSASWALIAVQGPRAVELVQSLADAQLPPHKNSITKGKISGVDALIARSGYTGEDGFELFVAPADATKVWNVLMEKGAPLGILPCGLGARDSLRTEVKNALYGNDIDDAHTPLEAGLNWVVKLDKPEFIGKPVLDKQKAEGITRKLVGFETEKLIPRHGYPILKDGKRVGEVTSGTQSPTLKKPIGMGYVPVELAVEGATFDVEIRGKPVPARVVKTPFYKRPA